MANLIEVLLRASGGAQVASESQVVTKNLDEITKVSQRLEQQLAAQAKQSTFIKSIQQQFAAKGITVETKDVSAAIASVNKEAQAAAQPVANFNTQLRDLATQAGLTIGLGMVIQRIGQFNAESMAAARTQESAKNALTSVLGSAQEYSAAINDAKMATRGMASEASLAGNINLLLGMGLAKNAQEASQLSQAASVLERVYGNVGGSTEKFFMLLSGGSPMLLNNFGMTKEMVAAKQQEITATQGLAGEEARMAAIRALAIEKANQYSGSLSQSSVQLAQTQAATEDFQAAWGSLLNSLAATTGIAATATDALRALEAGAKAWQAISQAGGMATAQDAIAAQYKSWEEYERAQRAARNSMMLTRNEFAVLQGKIAGVSGDVGVYNSRLTASASATAGANTATAGYTVTLKSLALTQDAVNKKLDEYNSKMVEIGASPYSAAVSQANQLDNAWGVVLSKSSAYRNELMDKSFATSPYTTAVTSANTQAVIDRNEEQRKATEDAGRKQQQAVQKAADALRSTIESVMQPTLEEVYKPPAGFEQRIDENARRLADVAKLGGKSPWADVLMQQYAGQGWWQPMADAITSGNRDAMEAAANAILANPADLTRMWDVPTIVQKTKDALAAQNAREQIIQAVMAELSGQGINVSAGEVAATMGGGGTAGLAGMLTGTLATDMQGAVGASGVPAAMIGSIRDGISKADKEMMALANTFAGGFEKALPAAMGKTGNAVINAIADRVAYILSGGGGEGEARP